MSDSEKLYVLVWDLEKKRPEFKVRFKHRVLDLVVRPKLVFFAFENRLSVFERRTMTHILKLPVKTKTGTNLLLTLGKEEQIKQVESIFASNIDQPNKNQIMLFLPENSCSLLYLTLDSSLEMQFDYISERKRVSVSRRTSRLSTKKSVLGNNQIKYLEEISPKQVMSFTKKSQVVREDIHEGTDTDPEKDLFNVSSSIYFNAETQNADIKEKGILCLQTFPKHKK